jgi:hypothetical protein
MKRRCLERERPIAPRIPAVRNRERVEMFGGFVVVLKGGVRHPHILGRKGRDFLNAPFII